MRIIFCHDRRDLIRSYERTGDFGQILVANEIETVVLIPLDVDETLPQIKVPDAVKALPSFEPRIDGADRVDQIAGMIHDQVAFQADDVLVGYCYSAWLPHLVKRLRESGLNVTHVQTIEDPTPAHMRAAIRCFPTVDLYTVLNDEIGRTLQQEMRDYNVNRPAVAVVPNGIQPRRLSYDERPAAPPLRLCYYGDLVHEGFRVLDVADVAALLKRDGVDFTINFIGAGRDQKALQQRIEHHSLQNHISLDGDISLEDMRPHWAKFHAILWPRSLHGFPQALIEAMAHGLLPIAARTADIDTVIIHQSNGYVFPVGEPKDAATMVKRILNDPLAYSRLSRKAHTTALNDLTVVARIENFLNNIAAIKDTRGGKPTREPESLMTPSMLDNPFMPRSLSRLAKRFQRRREGKGDEESEHGSAPPA